MLDQVLSAVPIFAIRQNKSRYVTIFDAIRTPHVLVLSAIHGERTHSESLAIEEKEKEVAALNNDVDFFEKLIGEEFIEEIYFDKVEDDVKQVPVQSTSKLLTKFPDILDHIKEILKMHGVDATEKKRRDDKTHTIAVGTRRIREMLHSEHNEDVSRMSIWRFFKCARVTDRRSVRDGGRHSFLDASTTTVRNSQFVNPHVRGQWCAAQVRDLHEAFSERSHRLKETCVCIAIDTSK